MNRTWLLENADAPIRYNLTGDDALTDAVLENSEVSAWFAYLSERSDADYIGDIHGSHDYRMENILGKCWILGLNRKIPAFAEKIEFITRYLHKHIETPPSDEAGFGRLYHYRDCEKVLACYLPWLGYHNDPAVQYITNQRLEKLYNFTEQKRYDIYTDGSALKGVKKDWQPYIINPDLYADGHIALPDKHDYILLAGMYPHLTVHEQAKVETIAAWMFEDGYAGISHRYGYFYIPGGAYNTKAIITKLNLLDFKNNTYDKGDLVSLVFTVFLLSHFETAKNSEWFNQAMQYLNSFKNDSGRYHFPSHMITEKPDCYVNSGGHMNVGENKKSKLYSEIISTYWMERILQNL